MPDLIDLRSDTVTKPTPAMRRAMAGAEVGDDVYGEDPTVNRLEEMSAEMLGKQAAVFVPSGTMANQAAILAHTRPGHEIVCDDRAHIVLYEMGGPAFHAGCVTRTIPTPDGILRWDLIAPRVRPASDHFRGAGLIEIENTHNQGGGRVYPLEVIEEIAKGAHEANVPLHVDGARIFNAAAYLNVPVSRVARDADSVAFCLSKGLGAPVGSLLCGSRDLMQEARLYRKVLGGGMRQAGVLAAAGILALEETPNDIPADHENARYLSEELANIPGITIDPAQVQTNILFFTVEGTGLSPREFSEELKARGVLANASTGGRLRMVTHHDVTRRGCERAIEAVAEVAQSKAVRV